MGIVDANILVRYITNDAPDKAERARLFVNQVKEGLNVALNEAVIAEVVHVLTSKSLYGYSREVVKEYLVTFLNLKGVVIPNRNVVTRALTIFASAKIDFVDALLAAYVEQGKFEHVISFDEKIAKATGVRVEALLT